MTKVEVKEALASQLWEHFGKWMNGQTVGLNADQTTDYCAWDVKDFQEQLEGVLKKARFAVWD